MNILTAAQIRAWDAFTIQQEPIASIDLMERAANACVQHISGMTGKNSRGHSVFFVFCGQGNNGGDGLAIARILHQKGYGVKVFVLQTPNSAADFTTNLNRLQHLSVSIDWIVGDEELPPMDAEVTVIDALYGTGLNRPLEGLAARLVDHINQHSACTISIDMPSGLLADEYTPSQHIIKAHTTLSFQCPKLAFMMAENEVYAGDWKILDIGLHTAYEPQGTVALEWVSKNAAWLHPKKYRRHAHKGVLGHALLSAGSNEKMGAAIMSASACIRSGTGLLTMAVPKKSFGILQARVPEAMCISQKDSFTEYFLSTTKTSAVGAGPGWGLSPDMAELLEEIMVNTQVPLLLDASALYHLSANLHWLKLRPPGVDTILTPHLGEFARLFGSSANGFDRLKLALEKARELNVCIVLKGAFTQVITPGGLCYFNSSGNPGMAKGGSGDVLTGIITSLLAQRYPTTLACVLGVYVHGLAGDIAAKKYSQTGMTAMDIVACLPDAWKELG